MAKIVMLKNSVGMADGIHSKEYLAGECYEVPEGLAKNFLAMEVAKRDEENPHEKAESQAPKNKAQAKAPKNKSQVGDE